MFCTDLTYLSKLKEENLHKDWDIVLGPQDVFIKPVIELLNRHPGIATRWCCRGHVLRQGDKSSRGYVTLAVDQNGIGTLLKLLQEHIRAAHPFTSSRKYELYFTTLLCDGGQLFMTLKTPKGSVATESQDRQDAWWIELETTLKHIYAEMGIR